MSRGLSPSIYLYIFVNICLSIPSSIFISISYLYLITFCCSEGNQWLKIKSEAPLSISPSSSPPSPPPPSGLRNYCSLCGFAVHRWMMLFRFDLLLTRCWNEHDGEEYSLATWTGYSQRNWKSRRENWFWEDTALYWTFPASEREAIVLFWIRTSFPLAFFSPLEIYSSGYCVLE